MACWLLFQILAHTAIITSVLHHLRNGHNRLKNHTSRFQIIREDIDGSFRDRFCRFGCSAVENASHVIIEYPHFNPPRAPLKRFFQFNSLEFDLISVSGQNPIIPVHLQFKVRDQFAKFLTNDDILKMIWSFTSSVLPYFSIQIKLYSNYLCPYPTPVYMLPLGLT